MFCEQGIIFQARAWGYSLSPGAIPILKCSGLLVKSIVVLFSVLSMHDGALKLTCAHIYPCGSLHVSA